MRGHHARALKNTLVRHDMFYPCMCRGLYYQKVCKLSVASTITPASGFFFGFSFEEVLR